MESSRAAGLRLRSGRILIQRLLQQNLNIAHVLKAFGSIFPEAKRDDPVELSWRAGDQILDRREIVTQNRTERRDDSIPGKRPPSGDHFIEDRPERKDI